MKHLNKLLIIFFSVLVTEVITKSFNSKVDLFKVFLSQNENVRGHTSSEEPISGKSLSTIFGFKSYPLILQETAKQLQNECQLLRNFYLSRKNKHLQYYDINARDPIEILMKNHQKYIENLRLYSGQNQIFYPDYVKKFLAIHKNPFNFRQMKSYNFDIKNKFINDHLLDRTKVSNRNYKYLQRYKKNLVWPIIHEKIIDKRSSRQTTFIPSVNVGALTNLGTFFDNLKTNVDFMEKSGLTSNQRHLLDGDHPIKSLRRELDEHTLNLQRPQNEDFLHTIRNYRPSQRVRALVSMTPEGYHGSNFIDPNYMWLGLGK